jgi:DNA segregation ATPase FtsK/SpoIIIE, S-DNA-T family
VNSGLSLRAIRAELGTFRSYQTGAAAREDAHAKEAARRMAVLARNAERTLAAFNDEAARRRAETEKAGCDAVEAAKINGVRRRERLQKAATTRKLRLQARFEAQNGREVFGFQKGTLDAEKRHAADLASAEARWAAISAAIQAATGDWIDRRARLRRAYGGVGKFRRWFSDERPWSQPDLGPDEDHALAAATAAIAELDAAARRAGVHPLALGCRLFPAWACLLVPAGLAAAAVFALPALGRPAIPATQAAEGAAGLFALAASARWVAARLLHGPAEAAAHKLSDARHRLDSALTRAATRREAEIGAAQTLFTTTTQSIRDQWTDHEITFAAERQATLDALTRRAEGANAKCARLAARSIERAERRRKSNAATLESELLAELARIKDANAAEAQRMERFIASEREALAAESGPIRAALDEFFAAAARTALSTVAPWSDPAWESWTPGDGSRDAASFGTVTISPQAAGIPKPARAANGDDDLALPLFLVQPEDSVVALETDKVGAEEAGDVLFNLALRLLCLSRPGGIRLTVLDPAGLGRTFASLMHLADYADARSGAGRRIWTEPAEIEERLAELTTQLEKVLQTYLRNEFANLAEYNAKAGALAEPLHLLVVGGFPLNFSEPAVRRLMNLITNGGRCGILTLVHWDRRRGSPVGFLPEELGKAGVHLIRTAAGWNAAPSLGPGVRIAVESPPPPGLASALLHKIGAAGARAGRVISPFAEIAPDPAGIWGESTRDEIRIPIGRTGAAKVQELSLGKGTRQHALISGKTGSGKSNLLHVIVTSLALRCSPDEIEFYLVDFKKGVEFKAYAAARLPQARVVAIESDRDFGLSVLERVDEELRRRGELFRTHGVQDMPGYRKATDQPLPRCLLLVDEFQEFFVQEDRVSHNAAGLLDRIVRQGRAFGVHVILASQTLGGAYALARATLGQMAVRIAFHCDEADAHLIMNDENSHPRLLSRPGEGLYNDAAGAVEANSPFQAAWLPDDERETLLAALRLRADGGHWAASTPVVFEGSAPARIQENTLLARCLATPPVRPPPTALGWLGAPNSIKDPTAAAFSRAAGSNLLIVGQRDDTTLSLLVSSVISLAAQFPPDAARFVIIDSAAQGSPAAGLLDRVVNALPQPVERLTPGQAAEAVERLAADLDARITSGSDGQPEVFIVVAGLQNCRKLKPDDSFGFGSTDGDAARAAAAFQRIYTEGPALGLHLLVSADSYGNANRFLGRKGVGEFEMRTLLQMSASDSSSLVDQPTAASLGLYGGLFYNDREGGIETFRPYSPPDPACLADISARLQARRSR